jgi:hypothetical protein
MNGDGVDVSGPKEGVSFALNAVGSKARVGWPWASDDAWLFLDRNANARVDNGSELFGNTTQLRGGGFATHGYHALAELDENRDGWIDETDSVFALLMAWSDMNRNGLSDVGELTLIGDAGITRLGTAFKTSRRRDRWGNVFRYRGDVITVFGKRRSFDVFLSSECGAAELGEVPAHSQR